MDVDTDMPGPSSSSSSRAGPGPALHAYARRTHTPEATGSGEYPSLVIRNVHLPFESDDPTLADPLYNVYCVGSRVDRVELATPHGSRSVSHGSSGHNSPARHPEYHHHGGGGSAYGGRGAGSPPSRQGHAELDAQGRGILLPACVFRSLIALRAFCGGTLAQSHACRRDLAIT